MSAKVALAKMHGARNDFVVLDRRTAHLDDLFAFARWACDRHAGIGADGVIAIEAAPSGLRMRTINADGSEAEMCGNGVRCAARFIDEAGEGERTTFQTAAGPIETEIVARTPEYLVRVAMGKPRIVRNGVASLPGAHFVELGNPHVVFFRETLDDTDLPALAAQVQRLPGFPSGANVHVAALRDRASLHLRHWERGAGLTMACGTGAVACAAIAIEDGRAASPVDVHVPGGTLAVEWDGRGIAYLTGPAVRVFDTEVRV